MATDPDRYAHSTRTTPSPSPSSRIAIDSLLNPSNAGSTESLPEAPMTLHPQRSHDHPSYPHHLPPQASPYLHYPTSPQNYSHSPHASYDVHADPSRGYHVASANPSPSVYGGGRDRFPSVSSSSSTAADKQSPIRRPPRPKYEEEEMYFIWYHRVDLRQEWRQVRESFNAQFPNRQRSGFQGIQCKFYRFIREKQCPTLRDQKQQENQPGKGASASSPVDDGPAYGVVNWTGVWFPWMKEPPPPAYRQ